MQIAISDLEELDKFISGSKYASEFLKLNGYNNILEFLGVEYIKFINDNICSIDLVKLSNFDKGKDLLLKYFMKNLSGIKEVKIAVLYDTDIDGVISGVLMYSFLTKLFVKKNVFEFYNVAKLHNITDEIVEKCKLNDISLLVCVDCGSNDIEKIKELNANGISVLVVDHHELLSESVQFFKESVNNVLINCKIDLDEHRYLSGGMVVYFFVKYVIQEIKRLYGEINLDINDRLAYWTIVSDACPMTTRLNRAILFSMIFNGVTDNNLSYRYYNYLNSSNYELFKFKKASGKVFVNRNFYDYYLFPLLNSTIRIGQIDKIINVLKHSYDSDSIDMFLTKAVDFLDIQKNLLKVIINSAKFLSKGDFLVAVLDEFDYEDCIKIYSLNYSNYEYLSEINLPIILYNLTGLVASYLSQLYNKPSVFLVNSNLFRDTIKVQQVVYKGSFRAQQNMDFLSIFRQNNLKAYGHKNAFGIYATIDDIDTITKLKYNNTQNTNEFFIDMKLSQYMFIQEQDLYAIAFINDFLGNIIFDIRFDGKLNVDLNNILAGLLNVNNSQVSHQDDIVKFNDEIQTKHLVKVKLVELIKSDKRISNSKLLSKLELFSTMNHLELLWFVDTGRYKELQKQTIMILDSIKIKPILSNNKITCLLHV